MRGEKSMRENFDTQTPGSSPHARGKGRVTFVFPWEIRIIPACAGKSLSILIELRDDQDHPRMRGEKSRMETRPIPFLGSSPHARGKASRRYAPLLRYRIIPACAGKSLLRNLLPGRTQDHPRMRGEKQAACHRGSQD